MGQSGLNMQVMTLEFSQHAKLPSFHRIQQYLTCGLFLRRISPMDIVASHQRGHLRHDTTKLGGDSLSIFDYSVAGI